MSDRNFFAALKQRKLVQWAAAYVAAAFLAELTRRSISKVAVVYAPRLRGA